MNLEVRDLKLGTLSNGGVIKVDVRLHERRGAFQTIDHSWIDAYQVFAISAGEWHGLGCGHCGQMQETLRTATWSRGTDRARVKAVLALWDRWHLNDMHADCVHQAPIRDYLSGVAWTVRQAVETDKCPLGYVYGSKWLVEPLPVEVVAQITDLFFK